MFCVCTSNLVPITKYKQPQFIGSERVLWIPQKIKNRELSQLMDYAGYPRVRGHTGHTPRNAAPGSRPGAAKSTPAGGGMARISEGETFDLTEPPVKSWSLLRNSDSV